ncbi:TonB-dependent siderophore receptor [Myroides odoratimimus]|uniref:TonB-dependent receptor n=1 Tax=Myroides odoratimimus TaxID=76832 RepID=UPI00024618D4|nr:TonB-dependent receptor [Myroides odoratimimus]EHO12795.1 TonB-dependent siderophore receptor [Myroides odoratimimus CCUG 12901]MCA4793075.1 TonB-dependent siderophore receptor [Myroides odoratimimus]MCA4806792.1 TonB-dependent siderophore receptor [Myroides odoratimimus]MCA4820336.1 TonB-dependent siderophore receptor [Myroides odoratimimus]MCS7475051.1 TonB-dependent receptor [Myroides odoratimimus]
MKKFFLINTSHKFILTGLLLINISTYAQEKGNIKGTVVSHNQEKLAGTTITLNNNLFKTVSDNNGYYLLENIESGKYLITLQYKNSITKDSIVIPANQTVIKDFMLFDDNNETLDAVVINTNKNIRSSSSLRTAANLLDVPQNIQVIDKGLMDDQISMTMSDAIAQNVSGVRSVLHQEQASAGIYVRGYGASNLRNGMDISGSFGPIREDNTFIERVEFVKGPAGFMMGNTQPGGFYNIVTKKPTGSNKTTVKTILGSYNLYRAEVDVDTKLTKDERLLFRINGMATKASSFQLYNKNNYLSLAPSLKYNISDDTNITFEYIFNSNEFEGGFSKYAYSKKEFKELPRKFTFTDPIIDPTMIKEHNVFINLNHRLSADWNLTAKLGYVEATMEGESLYSIYNSIDDKGNVQRALSVNDAYNSAKVGQVYMNGKFKITDQIKNNVLFGLDMGQKEHMADWSEVADDKGVIIPVGPLFNIYNPVYGKLTKKDIPTYDRSRSLRERAAGNIQEYSYISLYVQDEFLLLDEKLRLGLGVRYTSTEKTTSASKGDVVKNQAYTPRFSITYNISPSFSAYALYDQSFQEQVGQLENNKTADPSKGTNKEFGLKKTWFEKKLFTSLAFYQVDKTNILTPRDASANNQIMVQSGKATSKGVEFDLNGQITDGLTLTMNYAYTDAKITEDNNPAKKGQLLPGTAKHSTNAWLTYRVQSGTFEGLGFSLGYQYQKDRSQAPVQAKKFLPDDYFTLDGGVSYKKNNYAFNLIVNNITDRYNYVGHFPGAWGYTHYGWRATTPLSFKLSLAYTF